MDWSVQHCHNSAHSQTKFNEINSESSLLPVASFSQFPVILAIMSRKNLGKIILFFNFRQIDFFFSGIISEYLTDHRYSTDQGDKMLL